MSTIAEVVCPQKEEEVSTSGGSTRINEQSTITKQNVPHAAKAWEHFRSLGSPKFHVAPMVDQSELPFRMLCRGAGSTAAYTPMLHARLFAEDKRYKAECWTTCPQDRPLFVQFCANDPDHLVRAAQMVEAECDYVDLNFGCPQRIAKRGYYGAFLMDNLPLVEKLVTNLSQSISTPVSCKIRIFPDLQKTLEYARMIERAGCSLLAVHGRTREMKDTSGTRADWDVIKAVKQAMSIPVLANGNIRNLADAHACMEYTGCDGVMSAESLLEDPFLFSPDRLLPGNEHTHVSGIAQAREYLKLVLQYPVPMRMVKGHLHKLIGGWLSEHTDLRDAVNQGTLSVQELIDNVVDELDTRVRNNGGRTVPIPAVIDRAALKAQREAALKALIEEQEREAAALAALDAQEAAELSRAAAHAREANLAVLTRHQRRQQHRCMLGVGAAAKPMNGEGEGQGADAMMQGAGTEEEVAA